MNSRLSSVALSSLAAIAAAISLPAQCAETAFGTAINSGVYQDDAVLPMQSLGFAFPFNGTNYTDVHVSTNGLFYLSNAGVPAPGSSGCCSGSTGTLVAGSPKIAPFWSDHVCDTPANGSQIFFNALPGRAVITWSDVRELGTADNIYTFQVQLYATGEIVFTYDSRCQIETGGDLLVGMSEGGGAAVPAASDYITGGVSATTTSYELFTSVGSFDLGGQSVFFVPSSPGYAFVPQPCPSGNSESYGVGCYEVTDSFYQLFPTPAVASAALSNTAITLVPAGSGYVVTSGGAFVPPSGAASSLTLTDDGQATTPALSAPFPYPGGTTNTLQVASNGMVWVATGNSATYTPSVATMLSNPQTGWYAWHDYNPTAAGGGQVKFEEVGSVAYVTWDGVYNYGGTSAADATWLQFQFDTATGQVVIAYGAVSANSSPTVPAGDPHLVGFSPGGPSADGGPVDFATQLPLVVSGMKPLALAGTNAVVDANVTYTLTDIPEFFPGSGVYLTTLFLSVNPLPGGFDLGIIGAPGCNAYIVTLDVDVGGQVTLAPTASWNLLLSSPTFAPGNVFAAQGVSLIQPNSLPNGQNAFGMTVSNGVLTTVGLW